MGKLLVVLLPLAVAASLAFASAAPAKEVEPFSFSLGNLVYDWDVESTEPLVRDTISFYGIGALVEHGLTIHRVFHPGTMRGVVSGHLSGTGPDIYTGELHGVITPEGMRGVVVMTRHREDGATDTFVGRWSASGHPTNPFGPPFFDPGYVVNFEGRFILSP